MRNPAPASRVTTLLLAVYFLIAFWIIVLKMNVPMEYKADAEMVNFIPYRASLILNESVSYAEILFNVLIFIPFGLYAHPLFRSWSFMQKAGLFFLFSLFFELSQFLFGIGSLDSTDLLNNTIGGILGLWIYLGIEKLIPNHEKAQKRTNIIGASATALILALIFYLKVNHLWLFRK